MNKDELITTLSDKLSSSKTDIKMLVETTFSTIINQLSNGESVRIVGFGNFEVRRRIARVGRNPLTGEEMQINATKTPFFAPGKRLKDAVKQK